MKRRGLVFQKMLLLFLMSSDRHSDSGPKGNESTLGRCKLEQYRHWDGFQHVPFISDMESSVLEDGPGIHIPPSKSCASPWRGGVTMNDASVNVHENAQAHFTDCFHHNAGCLCISENLEFANFIFIYLKLNIVDFLPYSWHVKSVRSATGSQFNLKFFHVKRHPSLAKQDTGARVHPQTESSIKCEVIVNS